MQIVREFFEFHLFHVLTHWHHEALLSRGTEVGSLLFIERNHTYPVSEPTFLLSPDSIDNINRAVVDVRAWHTDRFYPSVIESSPVLSRVAGDEVRGLAETVFGTHSFKTILVVSELPNSPRQRERSLELLREMGVGYVLEFPTLLQDVLNRVHPHGNYAPSHTLQTIRLLKRYNFTSRQQLEFPFMFEPPLAGQLPQVEVDTMSEDYIHEDDGDDDGVGESAGG